MQARATAVFVAGLILAGSALLPDSVRAQSNAAQSPAGTLESSPIGKVVTTSGSVAIEHVNAVVVQANLPAAHYQITGTRFFDTLGIPINYVVSNPSSYAYVDPAER